VSYEPTDKEGFEKWATGQGLSLEPVGARMKTRGGVPLPTYFEDQTEFAWRGWANRPHRETRMQIATHWPTPKHWEVTKDAADIPMRSKERLPRTFEPLADDAYHGMPRFGEVPTRRKAMSPVFSMPYGNEPALPASEAPIPMLLPASEAPIPMLLHCPVCGKQHIDKVQGGTLPADGSLYEPWTNPLHRSHLCAACGTIWRPADVCTTGVARIETKGKADTWSPE